MKLTDREWTAWAKEHYPPSSKIYSCDAVYGTPAEPSSSLWCASLVSPLELREPFAILDWGCGDGRLFNFLSARFRDFRYYGLERPGDFGARCVRRARQFFGHDPRASFDVYDTPTEAAALEEVSSVVMGSVATHVPLEQFAAILARLRPTLARGGTLVASCFIEETERCLNGVTYGHDDCYGYVSYTRQQLDDACERERMHFEISDMFAATDGSLHQILKLTT
jgi:SAM-dependent methyltransferase